MELSLEPLIELLVELPIDPLLLPIEPLDVPLLELPMDDPPVEPLDDPVVDLPMDDPLLVDCAKANGDAMRQPEMMLANMSLGLCI